MFVGVGIRINCILSGCAWPGEEKVSLGSLSQRRTGECCLNGHLISVRFVIRNEREGSTLTINKYHAKKVQLPSGERFDSKREYRRWKELQLMEKAGEISSLKRQVPFVLVCAHPPEFKRPIKYIADFVYIDERTSHVVVEDAKGMKTPAYNIKKRLMFDKYGIMIQEV